jgi:hypothetical protein
MAKKVHSNIIRSFTTYLRNHEFFILKLLKTDRYNSSSLLPVNPTQSFFSIYSRCRVKFQEIQQMV